MGDKKLLTCRASAPGKVILHGEHSVVYGKTAVAASLDLQTTSIIKEFVDNKAVICIHFLNLKMENVSFNCEDIRKNIISKTLHAEFNCETPELLKHEEHLSLINDYIKYFQTQNKYSFNKSQFRAIEIFLYIYCAISRLAEQDNTSLDLTVSSNLSLGSGIGSSASFAVSLSASILQYFRIRYPTLFTRFGKNQSTHNNNSIIELSEFDKNLISRWAFCCEKISHGNPSGVDNEICCYGSLLEFRKGDKPIFHKFTKSLKICLVNTHIERNTKDFVDKVILLRERYPDTLNSIMDACNSLTRSALNTINNIEKEENPDMCNNYFRNLSELFEMNHNLLKAIGVSHPALEEIFRISNSLGFGSKLTGAGGGGNAIVLIPPYKNSNEVEKLMTSLKDSGFGVNLTSLGGEGVTINTEYTNILK